MWSYKSVGTLGASITPWVGWIDTMARRAGSHGRPGLVGVWRPEVEKLEEVSCLRRWVCAQWRGVRGGVA